MIDERDVLERALRGFVPEPGMTERVLRRRERKRRNQRIRAGVLGVAVALAVALVGARSLVMGNVPLGTPAPTPPSPSAVLGGFLVVPPEGAEPSTPVAGDLVLSLDTTVSSGDQYKTTLYVYADGRMIWERHAAATGVPEGARWNSTGFLEQVLTAEGVETLRREALDSGLFEEDLHLKGEWVRNGDIYGTSIAVLGDDGKTISLEWARGNEDERPPTQAEMDTIRVLVDRLEAPAGWLPETAWKDRAIRAYVASDYWVGFTLVTKPDGECCLRPDPTELPSPADEILNEKLNQCITTDEARRLAEGFEAAGTPASDWAGFGVGTEYETGATGADGVPQTMVLYPNLPHWSC